MSISVQNGQGVQIIGMLITGVLRIFENAAKRATEKYRGALVCLNNVDVLEESKISYWAPPIWCLMYRYRK